VLVRDTTDRYRTAARVIEADRLAQLGRRVADVVHEINNPLHNVLANLDAVGRCWNAPEAARKGVDVGALVDAAATSAAEIRNIVSDLQVESRPDRESVTELDIAHVLKRALASIPHDLKARARITQELGDAPPIVTNESRLLQVFTNLLTNAFQALPDGRGGVHVSVSHDASRIVVEVADDGAGIAPEHLDHVFEPFFTTKPIGKGTGLGLAICLGIVRSLGGQITVESATGAGTRMRVSLPLVLGLPLSSRTSRPPG
jgi:signal transduction histidine kinase